LTTATDATRRATAATLETPTATRIWSWVGRHGASRLALQHGRRGREHRPHARGGHGRRGDDDRSERCARHGEASTRARAVPDGEDPVRAPLPSINGGGGCRSATDSLWILEVRVTRDARGRVGSSSSILRRPSSRRRSPVAGGFAPIRTDATTVPSLAQKWAAEPIYRVSYDQLTTGAVERSTAGSLIGDYQGVRDAIKAECSRC